MNTHLKQQAHTIPFSRIKDTLVVFVPAQTLTELSWPSSYDRTPPQDPINPLSSMKPNSLTFNMSYCVSKSKPLRAKYSNRTAA